MANNHQCDTGASVGGSYCILPVVVSTRNESGGNSVEVPVLQTQHSQHPFSISSMKRGRGRRSLARINTTLTPNTTSSTINTMDDNKTNTTTTVATVDRSNENELLIYCHSMRAKLPLQASSMCAGCDLYAAESALIEPANSFAVATDITLVSLPKDCYGRIAPRSGLSFKHSLIVGGGVIDRDYTGRISVILINCGKQPYRVTRGDRIAQLICEQYVRPVLRQQMTPPSLTTPVAAAAAQVTRQLSSISSSSTSLLGNNNNSIPYHSLTAAAANNDDDDYGELQPLLPPNLLDDNKDDVVADDGGDTNDTVLCSTNTSIDSETSSTNAYVWAVRAGNGFGSTGDV